MANVIRQAVSASGQQYRIVDDLPYHGGYFTIEVAKFYGDVCVWKMVGGCFATIEKANAEFDKLLLK